MLILFALILAIVLQLGAFVITVSLIRKTKFNASWIMISLGFMLMALRRTDEFIDIIRTPNYDSDIYVSSWTAVLISLLMFGGSIYIRRIFKLQDRVNRMRKENEKHILSAVIKTEEKEKKRFSKELHDGLGPVLASVKMSISALEKDKMCDTNKAIIDKTDHSINEAVRAVKEISNNLSPHLLERFGLEKAIKAFIGNLNADKNLKINISSNLNGKRFDEEMEVTVYRIAGELFTNTVKYANASSVDISVFYVNRQLQFSYADDGKGFNLSKDSLKGLGLSNIRSRVKSLGGSLEIHTKDGKGFFLKVNMPV